MNKISLNLISALAIITVVFGTIFVVAQQAQRRYANEPQIQLAEDAADQLKNGARPADIINASDHVQLWRSLAPFVIVYDKNGLPVAGNGYMANDFLPRVPIGVLQAAQNKDYHRVTWEPVSGLRFAAVSVAANNYYVLSGRSLKEVEKNVSQSLQLTMFGWLVSVLVLGLAYAFQKRL